MAIDHDTMCWMFSTAAQVVAALIGLFIMCAIFCREQIRIEGTQKTRGTIHMTATVAMIVAAIALAYDMYMIYQAPKELISSCSFIVFILLNIAPILFASYSVWAYLK